jgi:ribosome-binding protein aMBF1 (putative translation factor)
VISRRTLRNRYHYSNLVTPRVVSQFKATNGYFCVALWHDGKKKTVGVHRVVLETFVGECPEGHEAAHLNGNKQDNRLENLVWVTKKENHSHKKLHGTWQGGENNPNASLTDANAAEIIALIRSGMKQRDIAKHYDVSESVISSIKRGRSYGHVLAML